MPHSKSPTNDPLNLQKFALNDLLNVHLSILISPHTPSTASHCTPLHTPSHHLTPPQHPRTISRTISTLTVLTVLTHPQKSRSVCPYTTADFTTLDRSKFETNISRHNLRIDISYRAYLCPAGQMSHSDDPPRLYVPFLHSAGS
jgi:hypothetical protein